MECETAKHHVVVLGAGVIGLQTALALLSRHNRVTLISASWPGTLSDPHFTSMFSGAQWRSNPAITDLRQQAWDRATYLHWRSLVGADNSPAESGIELRSAEFFWDAPGPAYPIEGSHWWIKENFIPITRLSPEQCALKGFAGGIGFTYETFAINPSLHCKWLLRQCEKSNNFKTHTLRAKSIDQVLKEVPDAAALVNCTGIGAGELARDNACFPTKGQTVLVRGQAKSVVTRRHEEDGKEPWEALVIPRPGEEVTMLGGCKIAGDWSTDSDEEITKIILERCKPLVPELLNETGEFDVLAVRVGLRPSRNGRARVEGEQLPNGGFVVHNYGHHSAGFEGSVGAAESAVSLVLDHLE